MLWLYARVGRRRLTLAVALLCSLLLVACGSAPLSRNTGASGSSEPTPTLPPSLLFASPTSPETTNPASTGRASPEGPLLSIQTAGASLPIDPRVLGTNVPAWLGPERLANPTLQARTIASGTTLVRLPGGSWSNAYDWFACQQGDDAECHWTWAARPSDFIAFLTSTGAEAIWTVSPNQTSAQAAALVAFFNGDVADARRLGVDLRGRDWQTVGHWARLRASLGSPEPLNIALWEFGNEMYGAKQSTGPDCAPWGWEDVWTCDGTEYVTGIGQGAARSEGYLEFRSAMRAVDPRVMLGAVGVSRPSSWSNWGNKVIAAAGEVMDFYVIHEYAFNEPVSDPRLALAQPHQSWPRIVADIHAAFDQYAGGRRVPIAVTEHNLFATRDQDSSGMMLRAVNALFLADTIGQFVTHGIPIANQWNLVNGDPVNGTDYGMLDNQQFAPYPHYYVLPLWARVGNELLPTVSPYDAARELSVYAGRTESGSYTLLAINKTSQPITTQVELAGIADSFDLRVDVVQADALEATTVRFNGSAQVTGDLFAQPLNVRTGLQGPFEHTFPPYSVTLLQMQP